MHYIWIKSSLIFLLITSSIVFGVGIYSGYSTHILKRAENNPESISFDASNPIYSSVVYSFESQNIQNVTSSLQNQNIDDTVGEAGNAKATNYHYPVLIAQDFHYNRLLEYNAEVFVAVLDTGIDADHVDLNPVVASEVNFTDSPAGVTDTYGHGTPIAGIIAARGDNNPDVQGIAWNCSLLNVKVVDDRGRFSMSDLIKGIRWATDNGANIINISLVSTEKSIELEMAINYAWQTGVLIVAAAGNGGTDTPVYPAAYDHCIAVTAVDQNSNLVPLANYGDWVDIAAPGYKIYSTLPGNAYGYMYGTSFATAYISGLAATIFPFVQDSNDDGKLNDEVRQIILNNINNNQIQFIQN